MRTLIPVYNVRQARELAHRWIFPVNPSNSRRTAFVVASQWPNGGGALPMGFMWMVAVQIQAERRLDNIPGINAR